MIDKVAIGTMSVPIRSELAKATHSKEMLDYLISDPSQEVRARAIMNPWTSWTTLWSCYRMEDIFTKRYLAKNQNLPLLLLERLARDKDYIVRGYIAQNRKCPEDILEKLCRDKNEFVRNVARERYEKK